MTLDLKGKKVIAIGERDGVQGQAIVAAEVVEDNGGPDGIVAILGSPDAESAEMFAETISLGDPTYAGALARVSLNSRSFTSPNRRSVPRGRSHRVRGAD